MPTSIHYTNQQYSDVGQFYEKRVTDIFCHLMTRKH